MKMQRINLAKRCAALAAIGFSAAALTGCGESVKQFFAHDGTYVESSESETMSTDASTTTTVTTTTEATTTVATTTTPAETTTAPETTVSEDVTTVSNASTAPIATSPNAQDDDTKLLWSERGLEIVPIDSEDGYGQELKAGEQYLDWTLQSFDGQVNGSTVDDLHADFTYNGTLQVNGILTILPTSDANNPNGLYLRVDNQADFPYFPADSRERGKFIVENTAAVREMLGLDDPENATGSEVAVTMSVTALHIHYNTGGFDTITVSAASRR